MYTRVKMRKMCVRSRDGARFSPSAPRKPADPRVARTMQKRRAMRTAPARSRFPIVAAFALAAVVAAASLADLVVPGTYARETRAWALQGIAQDWLDVAIVAPLLAGAAAAAARGSRRAHAVLGGALMYTGYT